MKRPWAIRLAALALSLLVLQSPTAGAQNAAPTRGQSGLVAPASSAAAELDAMIARAVSDWQAPGLGVAIVRDGRILLVKGYGLRNLQTRQPVTADTLFPIASATKSFTATGVAQMVDAGRLGWDTPLSRTLPGFRLANRELTDGVTVRDMLSHRTGLPRHDAAWYNRNTLTRADLVRSLEFLEPTAALRERYQYNNLMLMTAGHVIERLSSQTWEEYTRRNILQPLGMRRTNFSIRTSMSDRDWAIGYRRRAGQVEPQPLLNVDRLGPAGAINSTPRDMAQWLLFHLGDGSMAGRRIVSPAQLDALHAPTQAVNNTPEGAFLSPQFTALGWFVETYRGVTRVQHGGNLPGAATAMTLIPERKLGIIVMTNLQSSRLPELLTRALADQLLGLPPADWLGQGLARQRQLEAAQATARQRMEAARVPNTRPSHAMASYAGAFTHPGYGQLRVAADAAGRLQAEFNGLRATLEHWHYDTFVARALPGQDDALDAELFTFETDSLGRVAAVRSGMEPRTDEIVFTRQTDPRLTNPAALAAFAGAYQDQDQVWRISLSGAALQLEIPGQPPSRLLPDIADGFRLESNRQARVVFRQTGAQVTAMEISQPEGVFSYPRVGQ
jgi:CubicO group peptidase (beta-lactamase class C family)